MEEIALSNDKSLVVIFTYALAGLGHLRVTKALSEGLPKDIDPVLFGSFDKNIQGIHSFISVHKITRDLMEWVQRGQPQKIFTRLYRKYLRSHTDVWYSQISLIFDQKIDVPRNIVVVATHFGLAHQLAVIKDKIEKEEGVKIFLVVQVTDDTPQYIWYVPGADLTFVPSEFTKKGLEEYGKQEKLPPIKIEVLPYPISPILDKKIDESRLDDRLGQLDPTCSKTINVCLPVSGAAVDMEFYSALIKKLDKKCPWFNFHVVLRDVPFTQLFMQKLKNRENVHLYTSPHDRRVVTLYEDTYVNNVISLEVTKPSEQAFKVLYDTNQIGGSVILFAKPVGRQEQDNLDFMRRHGFILSVEERDFLWKKSLNDESLGNDELNHIFSDEKKVRGIELPFGSTNASNFIYWALKNGVLKRISEHGLKAPKMDNIETRSDGVKLFWDRIGKMLIEENSVRIS